ncbi:MAG: VCBS repeat-containing protein [Myxococcales bacterium]|nr:VCBS repeat-containing protein [Myxococcales bacterium]
MRHEPVLAREEADQRRLADADVAGDGDEPAGTGCAHGAPRYRRKPAAVEVPARRETAIPWRTMRRVLACSAAAWLVGCDTPGPRCEDGVHEVGVVCLPDRAVVRVGYGFAPTAMLTADVDGDGHEDTVSASPSRQTLTIAWGPGLATSWALGEEIAGLAIGDVDGDGRVDVVTALPEHDAVAVLRGRGGRVFAAPRWYAAGDTPRAVIAADLVGDAAAEVVTANLGDGSVSVLKKGVADPPVIVGPGPHALAAGDFDNDGARDLFIALSDIDAVQVLHNEGGAWRTGEALQVGAAPLAVVAGDLDADGALDVATADALGDTVTVVLGDGAGAGRAKNTWEVPAQPQGLTVVPGVAPQLGVLSPGTGEVTLLNPRTGERAGTATLHGATAVASETVDGAPRLVYGGDGHTAGLRREAVGLRLESVWALPIEYGWAQTVADVDDDGADDVIAIEGIEYTVKLVRGATGEVIAGPLELGSMQETPDVLTGDVDGDGRTDLVAIVQAEAVVSVVTLVQGSPGVYGTTARAQIPAEFAGNGVLGDVDGDGRVDLLVNAGDGEALERRVLLGDGAGGWGAPSPMGPARGRSLAVDLDGDAYIDLVTITGERVLIIERDPGGDAPSSVELQLPWKHLTMRVAVGSLDGDAELDAVVCGLEGLLLVRRLPSLGLAAVEEIDTLPCGSHALRDADGDGDVDIAVETSVGGILALGLLVNDGGGHFAPGPLQPLGWDGELVFGDFDGDAQVDAANSDFVGITMYRGTLGPVLVEQPATPLGYEQTGSFGDFDGDGVDDRVMVAPGVAVAFAAGDGGFGPWHHAPLRGLVDEDVTRIVAHAVSDVDGDGADEIIVLGAGSSQLLRSLTRVEFDAAGAPQGAPIIRLASPAEQVFARDFDGDGIDDLLLTANHLPILAFLKGKPGGFEDVRTEAVGQFGRVLGIYDVDGDRRLDVVHGLFGLWVAPGDGHGHFGPAREWSQWSGGPAFAVADVNADRLVDLLEVEASGRLLLRRGQGEVGPVGAPVELLARATSVATADLDGDGALEVLATENGSDDTPERLHVGRATENGRFVFTTQVLPVRPGEAAGREIVVRDWDGDGVPDVGLVDDMGLTIVRQRP